MTTATNNPIIHVFSEINVGKYKGVKHYELVKVLNGTTQLSELINISKDRNCAKSIPDYWLKVRMGNKWSNCITGLFKTGAPNIFKGDSQRKKNLIIVKFSNDAKTLTAYFFANFYTKDLSNLLPLINK